MRRPYIKKLLGFAVILFGVAFLARVTAPDYSGIFISGESLAVSKTALLERWEAADNVQDDGMMLLLAQDESYLEVLCAPCGPFQFRGDRLETPEGEIHRGQSRTEAMSVFGEPLRISDAPEMGFEFSHEGYERRGAFGSVVARITVTYRETEVHSITITREDRSREFQRAHGHKFLNLEE